MTSVPRHTRQLSDWKELMWVNINLTTTRLSKLIPSSIANRIPYTISKKKAEEEEEPIVEEIVEPENDFVGECAIDLFIDALNPLSKKIHSTLKTTLERQREAIEHMKKQRAEQRAEEIRQQGVVVITFFK